VCREWFSAVSMMQVLQGFLVTGMGPGRGRDTAAMQASCISLPMPAVLAESALPHLWQEGEQGDLIESARLWQAVGVLVGLQSSFGLLP
jgi:hypothetical protein